MALVSQREYARLRQCSEAAVRKAIRAGKIINGVVYEDGRPKINVEVADSEWKLNYNPNYGHNNAEISRSMEEATASSIAGQERESISKVKHAEAALKAKLLNLKLQEQTNRLVDKTAITAKLYEMGQEIRNQILGLPARITDNLMEIKDRNEFQIYLENELALALEKMTEVVKKDL